MQNVKSYSAIAELRLTCSIYGTILEGEHVPTEEELVRQLSAHQVYTAIASIAVPGSVGAFRVHTKELQCLSVKEVE